MQAELFKRSVSYMEISIQNFLDARRT